MAYNNKKTEEDSSKKQADSGYFTDDSDRSSGNLYRYAEQRRHDRYKDWKGVGTEKYLEAIADEIKIRTRITKQEIFLIGELLCEVQETLKSVKGANFKDWVKENCEFGYDTALNFCRVFTVCLGRGSDIENVKISTLYKVSQKSFPKDLRDYLFDTGAIQKMSIKDVKVLYDEYEKNGFDAIPEKASVYTGKHVFREHVLTARSKVREAKKKLEIIQKSLAEEVGFTPFVDQKGARVQGDFVRKVIHSAFTDCIATLEKSLKDTFVEDVDDYEKKIDDLAALDGQDGASVSNFLPVVPTVVDEKPAALDDTNTAETNKTESGE